MMKVLDIKYNTQKTYSSFRTSLDIFVKELDYNLCGKIKEVQEALQDYLESYISVTFVYSKNVIRISINHNKETLEEIKEAISEICSGNGSFILMVSDSNNYYKFLSEIFIKYLDTSGKNLH